MNFVKYPTQDGQRRYVHKVIGRNFWITQKQKGKRLAALAFLMACQGLREPRKTSFFY